MDKSIQDIIFYFINYNSIANQLYNSQQQQVNETKVVEHSLNSNSLKAISYSEMNSATGSNFYGNGVSNIITRDSVFFALIVIILFYTFYRREKKMILENNTFKQILNHTPTLMILEINFFSSLVKTVSPILAPSDKMSSKNQNLYCQLLNTIELQKNQIVPIVSFCEALNIQIESLQKIILSPERTSKGGVVIKSICGKKKYRFSGKFDPITLVFTGLVLDISEEDNQLKKLKHILAHDPLTGLPNRYHLDKKIQKFCQKSETDNCSIFFIDLNKFKQINDTYGHDIGDQVLKHVSKQFQIYKDNSILPIRLSGDEFLIVKRGVDSLEHANSFITTYLNNVSSEIFTADGNSDCKIKINLSYGGVLFNKYETQVNSIIKYADEKMYEMKKGLSSSNIAIFN
ncbi:hypothetical protein CYY_002456 [Polysphondylium violaceum]|uniref:GGDEF domain-containing protein n=1 Tax=Polysphondylium violaceum TaxID=133409 RepID=A0A8J4V0T2_9MYCE|nr:hypothetical protein CYY_002456 [Polysphondylium violaceum]